MELKLNDKTLRKILIGVAIVAVIILIVNGLYRRSNYVFPPTDTAQEDNTLNTQVQECQTTYSQAILAGTDSTTAQAALKTCVSGKVSTYITAKCPYTSGDEPASTDTAGKAAWDVYQANIRAIRAAYVPRVAEANTTTFKLETIRAARKADLTGATRLYLATACPSTTGPGFYTQADYGTSVTTDATTGQTTVTATTVTYPDPVSQKYASWTAAATTGAGYGFDPTRVSGTSGQANILAWAVGAGVIPDNTITPTGALEATGTKYNAASAAGIPNWLVARDFGPGTIGTAVPVFYATAGTSTPSKQDISLPYTYAS